MAKRQFKTESKRILDLMINSIYTHKEVFLRELISNASDALDKLYFTALSEGGAGISREELGISIALDHDARTLVISDNGIGMTKDELIENLGTIAKSGTLDFKKDMSEGSDIIGQFGVGFYSAFMVSKKLVVDSRAYGADEAWRWESAGEDGYSIDPSDKADRGTTITVYLADDAEDEDFSRFLDQYTVSSLVKKYSDYIRYPITMQMQRSRPKEGAEGEYEDYTELETLNSMVPIWRRSKDELTDEDYNNFYRDKFFDYEAPVRVINTGVEGAVTYKALLYIPANAPYDFYTKNFKKGLQLYANGVLIMESCEELLSDHFAFVRGVVDSADLSLNISREMLQHDRQLKLIAKNLEKKIASELSKLMEEDREKYEKFFSAFGLQLKFGMYEGYGMHKDDLKDLVLFHSIAEGKLISFKEYAGKMPEGQKYIYYACGETREKIALLPQTDAVREKGYDILALTDDVDEFAIKLLNKYGEHEFRSVSDSDLGLETDEEKDELEKRAEQSKPLLESLANALEGKVKEVRLSSRLKAHPVCLVSGGDLSVDMEKVLNAQPTEHKVKADRVLELNASHPIFAALTAAQGDDEKLKKYAALLYDQALLISGLPIEDPVAFSNLVCELMA